ncbi:MAG: DNA repair exonuclease, partial [bacterium]|nr:DNA repair exonuclease [bacterium]
WHLGRTLHGFSLRDAQEQAVAFIVDLAISREVDVVIVAGDVFDRAVPPVESIRLLNSALARLDAAGITTIITSGNHDSGDRLATYSGLLRDR